MKGLILARKAVFIMLCAGVVISGVGLYGIYAEYIRGSREYEKLRESVAINMERSAKADDESSFNAETYLSSINNDYVGWLSIPGTPIDYPIVRDRGNGYYLNHTFEKQENICGAIFIPPDMSLQDDHEIIYGHNMKNGSMFGCLKKYLSMEYLKDHNQLVIFMDGQQYRYEIFSAYETIDNDPVPYITFNSVVDREQWERELPGNVQLYDKIVTLSTCHGKGKRLIVHAGLNL